MTMPNPITSAARVLSQIFLHIDSLKLDTDAFLRSLNVEPGMARCRGEATAYFQIRIAD